MPQFLFWCAFEHLDFRLPEFEAIGELFNINFIAVDFEKSSDLEYYYKLEGYDNDWIQTKNTQSETYTKVPPGAYTFKVQA